jgi:predicted NBD/HSP70 family sugar kinase
MKNPSVGVATRGTSREINRSIVLNLVRTHQPISRADLARIMNVRRGAVSRIVNDLIAERAIFEGATGQTVRGRKPTFLYIDSRRRAVVAADIRASETFLMLADLRGNPTTGVIRMPTSRDPRELASALAERIRRLLVENREVDACDGLGVVVPGMVEHSTMRVLHAPTLGWRNVDLRGPLVGATGLSVHIENSGRACALAQAWAMRGATGAPSDVVFVSVSDGIGVGVMIHGELLRGRHNVAGEFGHVPLSLDGPLCSCGANGCWEAYISNRATLARYFGKPLSNDVPTSSGNEHFTIDDLIARARGRDLKASAAIESTARYLGLGLAAVINTFDPACVFVGGEITRAWDLIEPTMRSAVAERALTEAVAATEIRPVAVTEYPRLRGAAALVVAPAYAVRGVA